MDAELAVHDENTLMSALKNPAVVLLAGLKPVCSFFGGRGTGRIPMRPCRR